jgi:hypothetical protein
MMLFATRYVHDCGGQEGKEEKQRGTGQAEEGDRVSVCVKARTVDTSTPAPSLPADANCTLIRTNCA